MELYQSICLAIKILAFIQYGDRILELHKPLHTVGYHRLYQTHTIVQRQLPYSKNFGSKKVWRIRTVGSLAEKRLVD